MSSRLQRVGAVAFAVLMVTSMVAGTAGVSAAGIDGIERTPETLSTSEAPATSLSGPVSTQTSGTGSEQPLGAERTYEVTNSGQSYYNLDGYEQPSITLVRGKTYTFNVDASGHPFHISTDSNGGDFSGIYTDGVSVTNPSSANDNATETGTLTFTVPLDAPDTLYYQCGQHSGMGATITVVDPGDGSAANPYVITNASELQDMNTDLDASYKLGNDIDASGIANFNPVHNTTSGPYGTFDPFDGSFDGANHTISNLTIDRPTETNVGLFGSTSSNVIIENVGVVNANMTGNDQVGGLAGLLFGGTVSNSYATGNVTGDTSDVGGLVGENNDGMVADSYATSSVHSSGLNTGGLVGYNNGGTVSSSYATGSVTGNTRTGGLVGNNNDGTVADSYATGSVTGDNDAAGGLVGYHSGGTVSGSNATGDVTGGREYTGGLVGQQLGGGAISESYATGNVTGGGPYTGGLTGSSYGTATVERVYAVGAVNGTDDVGGLVGYFGYTAGGSTIEEAYAAGAVTGNTDVGGLIGFDYGNGTVTDAYWDTETTGQASSPNGTGLTTAELKGSNATSNTNLDFTTNWSVVDTSTAISYPYLQANTQEPAPGLESLPTPFAGVGTVEDPFQIGNWSQLDSVREYPDASFTLVNDLNETTSDYADLASETANGGAGWQPIGVEAEPFTGSFDGDGHTVAGLRINRTTNDEAGLFGNASDVTIGRVTLDDVNVSGGSNASGLVGYATDVTITDVAVNGNVTGDSRTKFAGGAGLLAGYTVNATITNATANGNVLTNGIAGGVVGYVVNGTVENASMNENPRGIATYEGVEANVLGRAAGGIVGSTVPQSDGGIFASGSAIRNSTANATVVGQAFVGGLVGVGETVTGSTADGAVSGQAYTGGLTGLALGDVTDSAATGDVQRIFVENNGPEDTHGGLIGATGGNVTDSRATGNVTSSSDHVGGLVGTVGLSALGVSPSADLRVVNSTATGDVDGTSSVGGLVGTVTEGNVTDSTASGAVNADGDTAGGLVGEFITTGATETYSIANSSASGAVNTAASGGGLVGIARTAVIENSSASGDTTVTGLYAGGLVSELLAGSDVVDSSATGDVSANESYVGGLVGRVGEGNITDSDASGEVTVTGGGGLTSAEYIGGLAGGVERGSVTDSHASGEVTLVAGSGRGKFARVGGLIGNFGGRFGPGSSDFDGTLDNSSASGDVTGPTIVGGLVGESAGSITDSHASGDVTGNGDVSQGERGPQGNDTFGGLVGNVVAAGTVVTSTATGDVAARANVGGLVGVNSGSVTVSYATGAVAADSDVGGLIGRNGGSVNRTYAGGSVTGDGSGLVGFVFGDGNSADSYWDTEATGQSASAGNATGLTTSELKGSSAKTNTAFNFTANWSVVDNGTHVSYPYLQANSQQPAPGLERTAPPRSPGGGSSSSGSSAGSSSGGSSSGGSSGGADPQSVVSVSPVTDPDDDRTDGDSSTRASGDGDRPGAAAKAVSVRNVDPGERVAIVFESPDSEESTTDDETTIEGARPTEEPGAGAEPGEASRTSLRNVVPDGLDITFKRSGDYDLEVSSRDIDVFDRAMDDSNVPAAPDLSIDALDDDGKRFVSETNQRPVGFIEVDTKFDSGEVVEEATHKFRVRESYLAATGASVESVRLYRDEADGWRSLPTRQTAEDEAFYYFEADTPGFSVFAIGTSSPVFETGAASLDSFDETTGEFEATVPVENVGDAPGEFEATLTADGAVVATETVALEANATTDLTLAGSVDEPGSVTLRLAGQSIGAVTRLDDGAPTAEGDADAASQADGDGTAAVDADDADDDAASGLGASLAGLVLVLALGLFLFAVWRRRDDEEEEAGSEAGR